MIENAKKLECGGCGNNTFEIYAQGKDEELRIITVCKKCKSETVITVEKPKLRIEWGENGIGILAGFAR